MSKQYPFEPLEIVESALHGNTEARARFQELFGELIYNYPLKTFRLPRDRTADFYIYVFEADRIFKRLATFRGRNDAQFKTYLGFYVLRDLFFEWQRSAKEPDTVSLDATVPGNNSGPERATFEAGISDPVSSEGSAVDSEERSLFFKDVVMSMDVERRAVFKLLCLAEVDLNPDEIRLISQKSGRKYRETISLLEETRHELTKKDERTTALQDQLESIFGWILVYQKELAKAADKLMSVPEETAEHKKLCRQKQEWERKLEWRYRQQRQVQEKARQFRTTTPYKDIARLLNVPIGTVCSMVARTRAEILETIVDRIGSSQLRVS